MGYGITAAFGVVGIAAGLIGGPAAWIAGGSYVISGNFGLVTYLYSDPFPLFYPGRDVAVMLFVNWLFEKGIVRDDVVVAQQPLKLDDFEDGYRVRAEDSLVWMKPETLVRLVNVLEFCRRQSGPNFRSKPNLLLALKRAMPPSTRPVAAYTCPVSDEDESGWDA